MTTVLYILLAVAIPSVVYCLYRALSKGVALGEREAALEVEREHLAAKERADAAARAERAKELDERIAKSGADHDAAAAAELLREAFSGDTKAH
jgi:hypothetical protein